MTILSIVFILLEAVKEGRDFLMPCLPDIDPTLGNARLGMTEETREDAIMMKIIQSLFSCHESGMCSRMRCRFGQFFFFSKSQIWVARLYMRVLYSLQRI
jgi:hypothetical protein